MVKHGVVLTAGKERKFILAVDVGGTNMVGAVVDLTGCIIQRKQIPTQGENGPEARLVKLLSELKALAPLEDQIVGIGLGVPGVTDLTGQHVTLAPGLDWHDFNIGQLLQKTFNLPVWAENDVNAFLKGEHLQGAMADVQNGIAITIGTGIGAALLLNGRIYRGARGAAGEMGYWLLDSTTQIQDATGYGEFECFAAAPGIAQRAREAVQTAQSPGKLLELTENDPAKITAETVFKAAAQGDAVAQLVVDDTIAVLSMTLSNLSTVLDVEKIVIGGGVAQAGDLLLNPIRRRVQELSPYPPEIVCSCLGSDATIIGAAMGLLDTLL